MTWTWSHLTLAACVFGLIAAAIFVVRYLWEAGTDAWRNPFGRYLLTRKALLAVLFSVVLLNRADHLDWWGRLQEPVTAILMAAFAIQTFQPYRLLVKAQRDAKTTTDQEARR